MSTWNIAGDHGVSLYAGVRGGLVSDLRLHSVILGLVPGTEVLLRLDAVRNWQGGGGNSTIGHLIIFV